MDKFISVPVTGETNFLVSVSDVIAITRTSTTENKITYNSGNTATITSGTEVAVNDFRDALQNAMVLALETSWTNVVFTFVPPTAVSGIVIA
tara:strand:- start:304 stop:579 length:276 start_codon:yes stop_codon:yes gene_type:complete